MNIASLELCKELYELSGWETGTTGFCYHNNEMLVFGWMEGAIPAYDLGYLLRKLKPVLREQDDLQQLMTFNLMLSVSIDPEDALAKLAIGLFKQGILTNNKAQGV